MEKHTNALDERFHRETDTPIDRLPEPRQASVALYFVINRDIGLNVAKLDVINMLMRIVPHHGLALLIKRNLVIGATRKNFRRKQTRSNLATNTSAHVYELLSRLLTASR